MQKNDTTVWKILQCRANVFTLKSNCFLGIKVYLYRDILC